MNVKAKLSFLRFALPVLLGMVSMSAKAYRPFDSTDADVAEAGTVELELGPVGYLGSPDTHGLYAPSIIFNWGAIPNWEIVLQGRNLFLLQAAPGDRSPKLTETGLFVKGVLRGGSLQGKPGPSIATEVGTLLPTFHDEPGAGLSAAAIISERWPATTIHFNAEVALSRAHHLELFGGLIIEGPYRWSVRPVAELFVDREFEVTRQFSGLIGAIWRAADNLSFDAGLRGANKDGRNLYEARAGLTWKL